MFHEDRSRLHREGGPGASVLRLHDHLQRTPVTSVARAATAVGVSVPTATAAIRKLESIGLLRELTGGRRGRLYAYDKYLKILSEGTEPLP